MSDKPRFPRAVAMAVAAELCRALRPLTDKLIVAGSLRRGKPEVGDVEIVTNELLQVPRSEQEVFTRVGLPWKEPKER